MVNKFFEGLQSHSSAKIEILNRYYIPWLRKITLGEFNKNNCVVIDGFAGEGIYEDGQLGSPIILINGARDLCNQNLQYRRPCPNITILLIEGKEKNFNNLIQNIIGYYGDANYNENVVTFGQYPTIRVVIYNDSFENVMNSFLDQVNSNLIPSFCFVDPFGFSHTPFKLFQKYLKNNKAEILFNFMYEEVNRFITSDRDPSLVETYENLFGVENLDELRSEIKDTDAQIRKEAIINYYSKQLLGKTEANYVLNFEFKKSGRTKMFRSILLRVDMD
ncbi:Three-Cys-motif partner protein TcmP OS=Lysinibacillus sphaericus OX=1421 GN=LS41612_10595 PE=4 SV=1 [Lysinibacillus sphaericus]